ncbi:MAG: hypothetical protein OEQ53_06245 [Saprospiraceae bacterium]|nr:hypothetical protein [Saprospiraceae bacterium]
MSKLVVITITVVAGFLLSYFVNWLAGLAVGFVVIWFSQVHWREGWWMGFLSYFIIWGSYAYLLNAQNDNILSIQMGDLFGGLSIFSLIFATAVMGGVAGLLTGCMAASLHFKTDMLNS